MTIRFASSLAAGFLSTFLLAPFAAAQQGSYGQGQGTSGMSTGSSGGSGSGSKSGGQQNAAVSGFNGLDLGSLNLPGLNSANATRPTATGTGSSSRTTGPGSRRTTGRATRIPVTPGGSPFGAGGQNALGTQNNRQPQRRAQYVTRMDFAPPPNEPASTGEVRVAIEQSIAAVAPAGVSVAIDGSTAVLTGVVPSAGERALAERMALLEPGVRTVRNELKITPQPSHNP